MDRRIQYINILSLLAGVIVSIVIFTNWFAMLVSNIMPFLIIGVIGSVLSICSLKKSNSQIEKAIALCGLLLNIIPVGYFILLFFAIG